MDSTKKPVIAFFCAEYAFDPDSSMYAGGLGVLAADFVLEAADANLPFIALGLKYGPATPEGFAIVKDRLSNRPLTVTVPVRDRTVTVKAWRKQFAEATALMLLDTNCPENHPDDRELLAHIYDPRFYVRLAQQMILGIGGVCLLDALGIEPAIYHLNEGHTAFAALGVVATAAKKNNLDFARARQLVAEKIVASKHTIFSEAGMYIHSRELKEFIGAYCAERGIEASAVFEAGMFEENRDIFTTTNFLMHLAHRENGVSYLHVAAEKERHPQSALIPITNGIYKKRWRSPRWPAGTSPVDLSDQVLWQTKNHLRQELVTMVRHAAGVALNPRALTVVWARRFAAYKRPYLLFSDLGRLKQLASLADRPVQFVISGHAHDADGPNQQVIEKIKTLSATPAFRGVLAYLPEYSVMTATVLTRGADVWLNTPERGKEACGTSGMKAGLNGALECSVSDGWVDEVDWTERGWILPTEQTAKCLYDTLTEKIVPEFYARNEQGIPVAWVRRMRQTMALIDASYGAERMLRDYINKLYRLPR